MITNFYPRPPRGGRPPPQREPPRSTRYFYPRPPRGGRHADYMQICMAMLFLSTPSARRATVGGRAVRIDKAISIHALREEGDPPAPGRRRSRWTFLSTPSARRATDLRQIRGHAVAISIHALREEGDDSEQSADQYVGDFYPRPPRGGRLVPHSSNLAAILFLSTPSARRATAVEGAESVILEISIHALREEGDLRPGRKSEPQRDFYPRPPRGGRHWRDWAMP